MKRSYPYLGEVCNWVDPGVIVIGAFMLYSSLTNLGKNELEACPYISINVPLLLSKGERRFFQSRNGYGFASLPLSRGPFQIYGTLVLG